MNSVRVKYPERALTRYFLSKTLVGSELAGHKFKSAEISCFAFRNIDNPVNTNDFKKVRRLVLFNFEFVMFTRLLLGITGRPTDPVEDDLIPIKLDVTCYIFNSQLCVRG